MCSILNSDFTISSFFCRYPSQKEWQRKEQLYLKIIDYFDNDKQWEHAIPLCKGAAFSREIVPQNFLPILGKLFGTGKKLSEAHIFASTNPQYDNRLFIESHENSKLRTCCVHKLFFCFDIQNNLCTQHVLSLKFSCTELVIQ